MDIFFKKSEIIKSSTAKKNGIDNSVPLNLHDNMLRSFYGMQLVRKCLGVPIIVSSWYRCKALNDILRSSSPKSHHMQCLAIDFSPKGMTLDEAYNKIIKSGIKFDQLLFEKNSKGKRWLHISFHPKARRDYKRLTVK